MKIIVTGATGFVGAPLVRALVAAGHEVTALTRNAERAGKQLPARCRVLSWTPPNELPDTVLRGSDVVVHLAGEGIADARWSEERKRALGASRIDTAKSLVAAMAKLEPSARPRAFISASAIGWYGDRGDERLTEDSSPGQGFLADLCRDWERATFQAAEVGLRTVAVRIGVVLGRGGGALQPLLPLFRLGLGGRVGSGRQWFSWIHLEDLVALLRFAIENDSVHGVINGVAPAPVTNATFTAELARVLHRPAFLPVPAVALRVALGEMSSLLLGSQRVEPHVAQQLGFTFRYPTLSAALEDLCSDSSHELAMEQWLAQPPEEVFQFFCDPHNLERITPSFLQFKVTGVSTASLQDGTLIDYALRLHGLPVRWQSRIDAWTPNRKFVDTQTRGPYALWHHTHEFEPCAGGTIVRDRVRYQLPMGALGDLCGSWLVRRDLNSIFDFRRSEIARLLVDRTPPAN